MDRGPIRPSRTAGGGMINNRPESEPATRRADEPQATPAPRAVEAEPVHHRSSIHEAMKPAKKPRKKRFIVLIIAIIVVIGLAVGGWFFWQNQQNNNTGINTKEYQAVFLTNGQNYFGKLVAFNSKYMQLTDVYYLQTSSADSASQDTTTDTNYQLVKLGNELHGPEDQMMIAKDQILFYENLKPTGKVAQLIAKDQKN